MKPAPNVGRVLREPPMLGEADRALCMHLLEPLTQSDELHREGVELALHADGGQH